MRALTTILLLLALPSLAQAGMLKGVWMRGDGNARVRIEDCGSQICAINEWIKPGTPSEKAGDKLIMNVSPNGEDKYEGTAKDPQRGLSYRLKITVADKSMVTRGCILANMICKSVNWSRVQ